MVESLTTGIPDRFRLIGEIGQGAYKKVWHARDELLRRDVAIAIFKDNSGDSRSALLEAQRMARVSDHPRITTIYDVLLRQNQLILVLQLLNGGDVSTPITSWETRRRIILQVCEGLRHIHECGYVHGDLKPQNILLDARQNAFIADFGLSRMIDTRGASEPRIGTPMYMAPEVVRGEPTSYESDAYSLGCVLYELLCGRNAFPGSTIDEVSRAQLNLTPKPPHKINPEIPAFVSEIVMSLLIKSKEKRLSDPDTIAKALAERGHRRVRPNPINQQSNFVGRRKELRTVDKVLIEARTGRPQCLLIYGEIGVGKSELQNEIIRRADIAGFAICTARCFEADVLSFRTVVSALKPHSDMLGALSNAAEIESFLSSRGTDGESSMEPALNALQALEMMIQRMPVAIVIDDAHWMDEKSFWFFRELLESVQGQTEQKLLLTLSSRTSDQPVDLLANLRRFEHDALAQRLDLRGMSAVEVSELIRMKTGHRATGAKTQQLADISAGNPLYVVSALEAGNEASGAEALQDLLELKLSRLSSETQQVLRVAALIAGDPEPGLIATILQCTEDAIWGRLAEAEEIGIIRASGDSVTYSHPLYRTLLSARWGTLNRQRMEQQISVALETQLDRHPHRLPEYVVHLLNAGRFAEIRTAGARILSAAEAATHSRNWSQAYRFCKVALDEPADLSNLERGHLHYMAAMALRNMDDLDGADIDFDRAIELLRNTPGPDLVQAWKHKLISLSHRRSGAVDTQPLEDLLEKLESGDRQSWALALLAIADIRLDQMRPKESLSYAEKVAASGISLTDVHAASLFNILAGANEQLMRFDDANSAFSRALEHARASNREDRINESVCQMPRCRFFVGDFPGTLSLTSHARDLHRRTRNHRQLMRAVSSEISTEIALGRLADAEEHIEELRALLHRTGFDQLGGDVAFSHAQVSLINANFDGALSSVDELIGSDRLVQNSGPYQSIGSLYKAYIMKESGRDPVAMSLRHPKSMLGGAIDPFRTNRVCLNVLLAGDQDLLFIQESVDLLKQAETMGQIFTVSWVFFLPLVIACGLEKLGKIDEARDQLEKSLTLADDRQAALAGYQSCSTYATLLNRSGDEQASGDRKLEAQQRKKDLQAVSLKLRSQ